MRSCEGAGVIASLPSIPYSAELSYYLDGWLFLEGRV